MRMPSMSRSCSTASRVGAWRARVRELPMGRQNRSPARRAACSGASNRWIRNCRRMAYSSKVLRMVCSRCVAGDPAFGGRLGMAPREFMAEQARFVVQRQGDGVELVHALAGVAAAQVAAFHRLVDGAGEYLAPALFIAEHPVADRAGTVVVLGHRTAQPAVAVVAVPAVEPVLHHRAPPG